MQTAAFTLWLGPNGDEIMNRDFSLKDSSLRTRNCRTSVTSSRIKREALAENLDKQWRELRRHATIEKDPEMLLRLTDELDKRKRQSDAVGKHK